MEQEVILPVPLRLCSRGASRRAGGLRRRQFKMPRFAPSLLRPDSKVTSGLLIESDFVSPVIPKGVFFGLLLFFASRCLKYFLKYN